MMRFLASFVGVVCATNLPELNLQPTDTVVALFDRKVTEDEKAVTAAFEKVYDSFLRDFNVDAHHKLMSLIEPATASFLESKAFNGYRTVPGQAHCDAGAASSPSRAVAVKAVSAFPGGPLKRLFGFDLAKLTDI